MFFKINKVPFEVKPGIYFNYATSTHKVLHIYDDDRLCLAYKFGDNLRQIKSVIDIEAFKKAIISGKFLIVQEDEVLIPDLKECKCW